MTQGIRVASEATARRVFASAVDWPGLARSGKTADLALFALHTALPRYARLLAGIDLPSNAAFGSDRSFRLDEIILNVFENEAGSSGTEFGVPSRITTADRQPVRAGEADYRATIIAAAWAEFDAVVATAPAELRKGPRGGGRDRDRIVAHVVEADHAYAREIEDRSGPAAD